MEIQPKQKIGYIVSLDKDKLVWTDQSFLPVLPHLVQYSAPALFLGNSFPNLLCSIMVMNAAKCISF